MVDGVDVGARSAATRSPPPCRPVSAVPEVRARLLELQRDDHRDERRDRGRGPRHRLGGAPDAEVKVFLTADAGGPRRASGRRGGRHRRRGDPGVAAGPRPDRLRPRDRAADDGRRRGPRRHHAVHPRRGRRPGRRAGRASGPAERPREPTYEHPHAAPAVAGTRRGSMLYRCGAGRPRYFRRRYVVRQHGAERVPATGPVIFAANHIGVARRPAAGDLRAAAGARARPSRRCSRAASGRFLRRSGQIPLDRYHTDPRAIQHALRVLRDGAARRHLPRGQSRRRRARPVPPRCGVPRPGERGAGRPGDPDRHPGARRRHQLAPATGRARSTWSSASRSTSRRSRGRARTGSGREHARRCCGQRCWPRWTQRASALTGQDAARPAAGRPRRGPTPTPGSSTERDR